MFLNIVTIAMMVFMTVVGGFACYLIVIGENEKARKRHERKLQHQLKT